MAHHGVVDTADEARDAHHSLEVDPNDVKGRRVIPMGAGELEPELVGEGGLARVPGAEQRHVGLALERQRDLPRERIHSHDLRRVIEGPVPYERVDRCHRRVLYRLAVHKWTV